MDYFLNQSLWLVQTTIRLPTSYLIAAVAVLFTLYHWPIWRRYKYPTGPFPLPFLCNSLIFVKRGNPMKTLKALSKTYGEIIFIHIPAPVAVINGSEAIIECLVKNADVTSDRPPVKVGSHPLKFTEEYGDGFNMEHDWKPLRKHTLTMFRKHGVGNIGMENVVHEEMPYYIAELEKMVNKPVSLSDQLALSISNIISHLNFGQRFDYSSERLKTIQFPNWQREWRRDQRLPFVKYLGDPFGFHRAKKDVFDTVAFVKDQISSHMSTIDYDNPRDIIDAYIIRQKADDHRIFQDSEMLVTILQFYIAGTDTTSTTLDWAFLYAALHPAHQDKVANEIQKHLGDRRVSYEDRNEMHYTRAFIIEVLRASSIAISSVPHYAANDIVVRGVTIPKGTVLMPNLWGVHHDEVVYPEPDSFKPGRFLDEQGTFVKPDPKYFMPFGVGRRTCIGEPLARMESFIFFVSTIQRFKVTLVNHEKDLDMEGWMNFALSPPKHQLILTPRTE